MPLHKAHETAIVLEYAISGLAGSAAPHKVPTCHQQAALGLQDVVVHGSAAGPSATTRTGAVIAAMIQSRLKVAHPVGDGTFTVDIS